MTIIQPLLLRLIAGLTLLTVPTDGQDTVPPPPIRPLFILDTHVTASLEASIISTSPVDASETATTYLLNCAPSDGSCESLSHFPATVTHAPGSIFEGESQPNTAGPKFSWYCALGRSGVDPPLKYGECNRTTIFPSEGGEDSTQSESTELESCYVTGHSAAVVITAGIDKLGTETYELDPVKTLGRTTTTVFAEDYYEIWASEMEGMSCGHEATFNREVEATETGSGDGARETVIEAGSEEDAEGEEESEGDEDGNGSGASGPKAIWSWCAAAEALVLAMFILIM